MDVSERLRRIEEGGGRQREGYRVIFLLGVSEWLGVSVILLAAARKCGHGEDGQKIPLRPSHVPRGLTWLGLGGNELPPPAAAQWRMFMVVLHPAG